MSAEIRAGYTSTVAAFIGAFVSFCVIGTTLLVMLTSGVVIGKGFVALFIIGIVLSFLSTIFVGFSWNRTRRSLKRRSSNVAPLAEVQSPQLLSMPARSYDQPPSVTERTTNLLSTEYDPAKTGEFAEEISKELN